MKLMNILFAIFAIAISMVSLYLLTLLPVGTVIMDLTSPILEFIAPVVPGEVFPYFFNWEIFQRALVVSVLSNKNVESFVSRMMGGSFENMENKNNQMNM